MSAQELSPEIFATSLLSAGAAANLEIADAKFAKIESVCAFRASPAEPRSVGSHKSKTSRTAKIVYIGQFSALSIALGIGAALAVSTGTAFADTGGSSSPDSSAESAGPPASSSDSAGRSALGDSGDSDAASSSAAAVALDRPTYDDESDSFENVVESAADDESPDPADSEDDSLADADPIEPTPAQDSILLAEVAAVPRPRGSSSAVAAAHAEAKAAEPAVISTATNTAGSGDVVIEAESMSVSPSRNGRSYVDVAASAGEALVLEKKSTATAQVSLPEYTSIVVRAKGDHFWGAPVMAVSVDGERVSKLSVSREWTDYSIPVTGLAGDYTVSVAFINDFRIRWWGDRNLMIDSVTAVAAPPVVKAAASASVSGAVVIEAESMKVSAKKNGSTYSDRTASRGKALVLKKNATAAQSVTLPAFTGLVIRAKGDQFLGAPKMAVSVDGKLVSKVSVRSKEWTDYSVAVAGAAGAHTVSIAFTNDLSVKLLGDRNLHLDSITVIAAAVPEPSDPNPPPDAEEPPSAGTPPYFQGADWLWKPIASNAVLAENSELWVSYLAAPDKYRVANLYQYSVALVSPDEVTASTPRYDVKLTKPWGSDPFGALSVPIPEGAKIPPGSDGQIAVLDPTTGTAFGIWQAKYNKVKGTWSGSWGGMSNLDGNGVDQSGSATATNISRYAGVVTAVEFGAAIGANTGLDHALVFSTDIAGPDFVGPATKADGGNLAGVATPIPQGYRIQLDPTINVDAIVGITAGEKVIAKTLQTHGAYVVDQGGARMAFSFELLDDATSRNPGSVWTDAGLAWDYYDMNKIPWSKLRVIASPGESTR